LIWSKSVDNELSAYSPTELSKAKPMKARGRGKHKTQNKSPMKSRKRPVGVTARVRARAQAEADPTLEESTPARGNGALAPYNADETSSTPKQRRQLSRRDSEEAASRIMDNKLSHIDANKLKEIVNDQGLSPFDYILKEVRSKRVKAGRCSTKFWLGFWDSFGLTRDVGLELAAPKQEDDKIDPMLLEAIAQARAENPAERKPDGMLRWFETAGPCSEQEMYGIICAVQEGPTLIRVHALKIQVGLLGYISRCIKFL